jgi:phosphonoacetaldehyde hydrolase
MLQLRATPQLRAVIFDWAGTIVDCGSRAPVLAFQRLFQEFNIPVTTEEARRPMGSHKKEHIRCLLKQPRIAEYFYDINHRSPGEGDVEKMYNAFTPFQLQAIKECAHWIPGAQTTIRHLKSRGIRVGSCTGYSKDMMAPLMELVQGTDCMPECIVTASDIEKGRPAPDMIFEACRQLGISNPDKVSVWKVGDTILDIKEGVNANVTSIGVTDTGNEMGYKEDMLESLKKLSIFKLRQRQITDTMRSEGADAVIPSVAAICDIMP